ncbi:MAG: peptidylprolyl isomerase [Bacteroidaceae bacterium]|nr:peptidylprolyl isomerase [Bacteroidaceae bacterium]
MKHVTYLLSFIFYFLAQTATAQSSDPIVMRINGKDVPRSEFEYNYNKNNTDGVIDKKTVDEYAELFINYKLKVEAALDAHLDTLSSYQQEFRTYRDQQIRPLLVPSEAEEAEVQKYYDQMLGQLEGKQLVEPAHIFVRVMQQSTLDQQAAAKARIDSIYAVLQGGKDFAQLAAEASEDHATGVRGGVIGWIGPHQLLKELEDKIYSMQVGEVAEPMLSTVGWHILKLMDQKPLEPYDTLAPRIRQFLEARGMKDKLATTIVDSLAAGSQKSVEQVMDEQAELFAAQDDELKYLIQEYHDGLLLYEVCQRTVWEPAAKDTTALERYFKKNKKAYAFQKPHYAGALIQALNPALIADVKKAFKGRDEDSWAGIIKSQFNKDSVQVRFERRVFEQGENAMVDSLAFGIKKGKTRVNAKYPATAVVGRVLKKGPQRWTDVGPQVVTDYQAVKEQEFVDELRRRYKVEIYKEALKTVNKH